MKSSALPGLLLSVFFICCESQETQELAENPILDLTGTRWEHHYPDRGVGDVMIFYQEPVYPKGTEPNSNREKRGRFLVYGNWRLSGPSRGGLELEYPEMGTYEVKGDTLYMTEINFIWNVPSISKKEVKGYAIKGYSKWVLSDNGLLYPVYANNRTSSGWVESSPPKHLTEYMQVSKQ